MKKELILVGLKILEKRQTRKKERNSVLLTFCKKSQNVPLIPIRIPHQSKNNSKNSFLIS